MFDLFTKKRGNLKDDILSGLTVALALVPEAIAFAFVAGVPPLVGLYAAFFMGLITAIWGGRPGMISGATGAIAVVLVAVVAEGNEKFNGLGLELLFATVILAGIIQVIIGVLGLGRLIRLVPHPVMMGFVNGLAIVIFLAQLDMFKVRIDGAATDWLTGSAMGIMIGLVILTMAIIHFLPRFTKAVPGTLVAIVAMTLATHVLPISAVTVNDFIVTRNAVAAEKNYKSELFQTMKGELKVSEVDAKATELAAADLEVPEQEQSRKAGTFRVPGIPFTLTSLDHCTSLSQPFQNIKGPHSLNQGCRLAQCGILYGTHDGTPWERNYDQPLNIHDEPMSLNLQGIYRNRLPAFLHPLMQITNFNVLPTAHL